MVEIVPDAIGGGAEALALVGYEEGLAGTVHAWLAASGSDRVACFVNPCDELPDVEAMAADRARRDSPLFEYPTRDSYKGLALVTSAHWPEVLRDLGIGRVVVLVSDRRGRLAEIARARAAGLRLESAIHPTARVLEDAVLGDNVVLFADTAIGYRAVLGDGVVVNSKSNVDHHAVLRDGATLDPGVVLAGNVTVGTCAQLHTGAVVKNRIRIGDDAVVGAGAVIIRDVPAGSTVVGNPGRELRR